MTIPSPQPGSHQRATLLVALVVVAFIATALGVYGIGLSGFAANGTPSASSLETELQASASILPSPFATLSPEPTIAVSPSPTATSCVPPSPTIPSGAVPILYLHRVVAPPDAWLTWSADQRRKFLAYDVIPAAFAADLDWLQANGYTTILPRDLASHWDHGTPLPKRPVMITLDDGNQSWVATVLPMLQQRHMVAEFYLTIDAIVHHEITWAEVRTLAAAGMGIGAHDVHHVQLANLGANRPPASPDTMWAEVSEARTIIQQNVGVLPDSMAYVGGGFDSTLEALVRKAGYTTARSIIRGIHQSVANRYELRVVALAPHDDVISPYNGELVCGLPTFVAKVTGAAH